MNNTEEKTYEPGELFMQALRVSGGRILLRKLDKIVGDIPVELKALTPDGEDLDCKGRLGLSLEFAMNGRDQVYLTPKVSMTVQKKVNENDYDTALLYVDEDGNMSLDMPGQARLPLE